MRKNVWYVCLIFLCIPGLVLMGWTDEDVQPIPYNHKLHIEEAGLTCEDCHAGVNDRSRASIPNIEVCGDCHDDPEAENEHIGRVAEFVSQGMPIEWKQVHMVPDHAYFSHRRHVTLGQLDCAECHGDVTQMEQPFVEPFAEIDMDWCIDCHKQRTVNNDCYACHR